MIINKQKPIEFNSPHEVLFDRDDLKKAILWYSDKPVCRLKHVYLHGKYYAVSIYENKIHIHRLLMMYWEKRDLQRNEHVHHINGNKFNNLRKNLKIVDESEHISLHNKGRKFSDEHRMRISLSNKRRKGVKLSRKYNFNKSDLIDIYRGRISVNKIAEKYGCDWSTVDRHYKEFIFDNPELCKK